jgi:hypothetical protein
MTNYMNNTQRVLVYKSFIKQQKFELVLEQCRELEYCNNLKAIAEFNIRLQQFINHMYNIHYIM